MLLRRTHEFRRPTWKGRQHRPILLIVRATRRPPAGRLGDRARLRNGVRCGERGVHQMVEMALEAAVGADRHRPDTGPGPAAIKPRATRRGSPRWQTNLPLVSCLRDDLPVNKRLNSRNNTPDWQCLGYCSSWEPGRRKMELVGWLSAPHNQPAGTTTSDIRDGSVP